MSATLFTNAIWSPLRSWFSGNVRAKRAFQSDMQEPSLTCATKTLFVVLSSTSPASVASPFSTSTWKYLSPDGGHCSGGRGGSGNVSCGGAATDGGRGGSGGSGSGAAPDAGRGGRKRRAAGLHVIG